jgi:hypothetical protein
VADFHRLPEHPGDCMNEFVAAREERPLCHGINFHDINFYNRMEAGSQNVEI